MRTPILGLSLLLVACAAAPSFSQTFNLTVSEQDPTRREAAIEAAARVIDRRLQSLGEKMTDHTVAPTDAGATMMVSATSQEALLLTADELEKPFELSFMLEAPEATADIVVTGHGGFSETGITEDDIDWTTSETQPNGKARVGLEFTPEGKAKMEKLYTENAGKAVGLFIRGKLVSKLIVEEGAWQDRVVISDIPSVEIADTFSDDVNVGISVTFTLSE